MSGLNGIAICIEGGSWTTQNAFPLLHEIRHALIQLLESGRETTIDVGSLPMAPGDQQRLFEMLGTGEASARLDTFGKSQIHETAIPGVWVLEHFNTDDQPLTKSIEVTFIPSILKSQPEDIREGLERLNAQLGNQAEA